MSVRNAVDVSSNRSALAFLLRTLGKKCCSALLVSVCCVACTNNKLVLRPLYNSLDNRFEDRFLAYTDFDVNQTQQIEDLADHFHVWHRQTQMGSYSLLLNEVIEHLSDRNLVDADDVDRWSRSIRTFTSTIGSCNPFYQSVDILSSLSDDQIAEIRDRRESRRRSDNDNDDSSDNNNSERENDSDRMLSRSADGRVKQVRRYLRVIGFTLNKTQLEDLSQTMNSTIRPEVRFRVAVKPLNEEFYTLLEQRSDPNFEQKLIEHIDRRRQILTDRAEEARNYNRGVWEAYALRTFQSLDSDQRKIASAYLNGLSSTVRALAADEPSFKKSTASEYACAGKVINN